MRRFITKKKIKVPRYRLIYTFLIFIIALIVVLNVVLKFSLKKVDKEKFLNVIISNAFGTSFKSSNSNFKNFNFYYNVFGFPFIKSNPVIKDIPNIKDIIDDEPLVYIYNTYQTDKYYSPYYQSYNINTFVTQASLILQEDLKKLGINSLVESGSVAKVLKEQNIDYTLSYRGSRILIEEAKKNNNSLNYFFDIGRSDDKKDVTTYNYNELNYAKILFIVGTDNPNYQENQKFANALNEKLEVTLNGLSRGVSLRGGLGYHGVYNQDFSSNALLIYVGGKENTIAEVNRSLKVLAEVISNYVKEINNEEK